jgi:hypothetical protein
MKSAERCYEQMDQFGWHIHEEDSNLEDKLRQQRLKRGECPTCHRKTHKVSRFRNKREPLTVEGEVINGICLHCITKSSSTAPAKADAVPVPDAFVCDDDFTVTSEITLDTSIEQQQAPKRSNRYNSKPFESVSEETAMTNFRRRDNQVPTNIIGSYRGRRDRDRGQPSLSRLAEEENKKWIAAQRQQTFHPMSREMYLFNSECSLGIESTDGSENSSEHFRPPKLHPLSREMYLFNSEPSLSLSMNGSESSERSKILNQQSDRSLSLDEVIQNDIQNTRSGKPIKREPSSNSLSIVSSESGYSSDEQRTKSLPQDSTRLMTKREILQNQFGGDDGWHKKEHRCFTPDSFKPASIKPVEKKRPNRFSLTLKDLPLEKLRASDPTDHTYDFEMEIYNSRMWKSVDILRDAAAEANGEKFNHDDFVTEMGAELLATSSREKPESRTPSNAATEKMIISADELSTMMSSLSLPLSAVEEARMAKNISKRKGREFLSSIDQFASINDIPILIQCVKIRPMAVCTERAFQTLFLLSTNPEREGQLAREKILSSDGMECLISCLWQFIENDQVLRALFHVLWALLVFDLTDEVSIKTCMKKIQDCSVVEGILTAMCYATDITIQESGFDIIDRLAGLLPADTSDFETAITVLASIMKNMDIRSRAYSSGIFALNRLCQSSDARKRDVARCADCYEALRRVILSDSVSLRRREAACQVYWVVTSDRFAVSVLSKKIELAEDIIDALQGLTETSTCSAFFEAAVGTLANLALDTDNHTQLVEIGVVQLLCDVIRMYNSEDISLVCCTAIANLSASSQTRESMTALGAIDVLFASITSDFNCPEIGREAFRALCNLSDSSSEVKQIISCGLDKIFATYNLYDEDKFVQSTLCSMLERLSNDTISRKMMIAFPEIFDILASIIQANPSKKTIETHACSLLRNLSLEDNLESTLRSTTFVPFVVMTMAAHFDSEELFENACFFLSNVGSQHPEGFDELCTEDGINSMINAIQTNDTSTSLLEACCGALHAAIQDSDEHKNLCLSTGAVDAIICLIMVHPHDTFLLERALNVLVSLSSLEISGAAIDNAGGVGIVVDTMRSNATSPGIINLGSRFIVNMVATDPKYANEFVPAVVSMLSCAKDQIKNEEMIERICKSLHCLVLLSENCADRVISADGVAVIEMAMRENEGNIVITQVCNILLQILNKIT